MSVKDSQLDKMTIAELRELVVRTNACITGKSESIKRDMRDRWANEAREAGLHITELLPTAHKTPLRARAAALFQHPTNASLTWAGRGRRPRWLHEAGGNIDAFRVR